MPIFDIFLVEAILNGLLFGGVLALLALGLNLIFGVIDVVWICYAELMMIGMYAVYFLYVDYGVPLLAAFALCILLVALLGTVMHQLVIRPILGSEPINQLLVTGGMLFFLQALATLLFGIDFRNLGLSLPSVTIGDIYLPSSRIYAAGTALVAMLGVWLFLKKTYLGIAIRAISQDRAIMPLMGVDAEPHLPAHLGARRRARRARRLPPGAAVRRPPGDRPVLRPDHLHGLRHGRARQPDRRLHRRLHLRPVHLGRRLLLPARVGLRHGLRVLHRHDVPAPAGPVRRRG